MPACPNCGTSNSDAARFCAGCGQATVAPSAAPARRFCAHCGAENPAGAQFCAGCGQSMNAVPGAVGFASGYAPASNGPYAGFWIRFAAYIIDGLIIFVPLFIIGFAVAASAGSGSSAANGVIGLLELVGIVVGWLYFALQESGPKQATIGKRALGIYVTDLAGKRIGFGRASGRFFGKIVSGFIFYVGYMMAGWTQRKQALHDMMASTLVLKR